MRGNIRVALLYLAAWLDGNGCVPIDHLMEDAATAEISRAQLWQWIRHPKAQLAGGVNIDAELYQGMRTEILDALEADASPATADQLRSAAGLLDDLTLNDEFATFLTLKAYQLIS